ncbi:restriction endonuclease subunit S [Nostocales cyanobacterium LEGE 11386]|nr:restriction endonuclease subunit S [Nostocales cyanobacterium LEGE 11386]
MGKYQGYEKYKDSAVEWLGKIPEHWEVKRLKRFAKICNGCDHKDVWDENGEYPIIGSGGIFGRASQYLYDKPSVLLGRKGTIDKPQFINVPFWSVDTAYYTDIFSITNPKFFYYLCLTIDFDLYKYGSAVPSMTQEKLNQILFAAPPLDEQEAIARFLDHKTKQIDDLITKKEALLEKLDEKRTALISHAVTKGLDPSVPMKDSGIEWLGKIPEHWEMKRLKFISPEQSVGVVINPSSYIDENGTIPFIYGANIREYQIDFVNARRISEESNKILLKSQLKAGDIVVVRVGEPGVTSVIPNTVDTCNCASVMFVRQHKTFISEWLCHVFNSRIGRYQVELVQYGAAQKQFNIYHAVDFIFPTPPQYEQQMIVDYLAKENKSIESTKDAINRAIEQLKEYRTSLITNAVTGKIDVRQVPIP